MRRALERADAADLRVFLVGAEGEVPLLRRRPGDIVAHGKADLGAPVAAAGLAVSGLTGEGLTELVRQIGDALAPRAASAGIVTRERHRRALEAAISAMESAQDEICGGPSRMEIAAEHLRRAMRSLDSLVGRVDVEDLLDDIFASFCIGK